MEIKDAINKFDIGDTVICYYDNVIFKFFGTNRGFINQIVFNEELKKRIKHYEFEEPISYCMQNCDLFCYYESYFRVCRMILTEKTETFWK